MFNPVNPVNKQQHPKYWYRVRAYNPHGESERSNENNAVADDLICAAADDFDPVRDASIWTNVAGGADVSGAGGLLTGAALMFEGAGVRQAATIEVDVQLGGFLEFDLRAGNEQADGERWDNSEPGNEIWLEYSTNNGGSWHLLAEVDTVFPAVSNWVDFTFKLPAAACSRVSQFRWRQPMHDGEGLDVWALDNVCVRTVTPLVPGAPRFILASANSSNSVAILWLGGWGAEEYRIERSVNGQPWTLIGVTTAANEFFTDDNAAPGNLYAYRVKSVDGGLESSYSDIAYVEVKAQSTGLDFGDLPDLSLWDGISSQEGLNYATRLSEDGPRHEIVPGLQIGMTAPDGELDGQPHLESLGDDGVALFALRLRIAPEARNGDSTLIEVDNVPTPYKATNAAGRDVEERRASGTLTARDQSRISGLFTYFWVSAALVPNVELDLLIDGQPSVQAAGSDGWFQVDAALGRDVELTPFFNDWENASRGVDVEDIIVMRKAILGLAPSADITIENVEADGRTPVVVPIRLGGVDSLAGVQCGFVWDRSLLEFHGAESELLTGFDDRIHAETSDGKFKLLWDDPTLKGVDATRTNELLRLKFRVVSPARLPAVFRSDDSGISPVIVTKAGQIELSAIQGGAVRLASAKPDVSVIGAGDLQLQIERLGGSEISISFMTAAGRRYVLERSDALSSAHLLIPGVRARRVSGWNDENHGCFNRRVPC